MKATEGKKGFEPVNIYALYDSDIEKVVLIDTYANDKVAKKIIEARLQESNFAGANTLKLYRLITVDLFNPISMETDFEEIKLDTKSTPL